MARVMPISVPVVVLSNPRDVYLLLEAMRANRLAGTDDYRRLLDGYAQMVAAERNKANHVRAGETRSTDDALAVDGGEGVDWYSAERVAEAAGVTAQYVRRQAGRLRGQKVDGRWRIPADRAEEFVMRTKRGAA